MLLRILLFALSGNIIIFVFLIILLNFYPHQSAQELEITKIEAMNKYPLTGTFIPIYNQSDVLTNFLPLQNNVKQVITNYGQTFSFYFEYLPNRVSIGVNDNIKFVPHSLVNVPLSMAYYLNYNENRGRERLVSDTEIKENEIDPEFGILWQKGEGTKIALKEVIRLALAESDTTAAHILSDNVSPEDLEQVFLRLDIDYPKLKDETIEITTKQYSSILQALYFSSIINSYHSEELIQFLTQTRFNDMLVAGVPKDINVAHTVDFLDNDLYQDCGIVYVPNRPYILCMVSKSSEIEAQARMKFLSEKVYTYISAENIGR